MFQKTVWTIFKISLNLVALKRPTSFFKQTKTAFFFIYLIFNYSDVVFGESDHMAFHKLNEPWLVIETLNYTIF